MGFSVNEANLDLSFDGFFKEELALPWLPWVGKDFSKTEIKTMLLGESTYLWNDTTELLERSERDDHTRIVHQNHAMNFSKGTKYVRNIERAIFNKKHPSHAEKSQLWLSVIYHNLVLTAMKSIKHRPTEKDYEMGWDACIPIIDKLGVSHVISYGLEKPKVTALKSRLKAKGIEFKSQKLSHTDGKHTYTRIDIEYPSHTAKLVFIRHPSAFFSWKKWGACLQQERLSN
jgi:hypothetical protein